MLFFVSSRSKAELLVLYDAQCTHVTSQSIKRVFVIPNHHALTEFLVVIQYLLGAVARYYQSL